MKSALTNSHYFIEEDMSNVIFRCPCQQLLGMDHMILQPHVKASHLNNEDNNDQLGFVN